MKLVENMSMKRIYIIKINKLNVLFTLLICVGMIFFALYYYKNQYTTCSTSIDTNAEYVVFAMNDLGMHCMQNDYSAFMILPPANTLKVQVFKKGTEKAELINNGIEIKYEAINNTTSADKSNFWDFAADYGYHVEPNVGITGNQLSGFMQLSSDKKYYEATAIPITPYNDGSTVMNPYQTAKVTVYDKASKKVIATCESVVLPVSDELDCNVCHGNSNTNLAILTSHDKLSGTQLVADLANNIRHKCSECHQDNILGEKGKEGIKPLSEAMHGFHSTKMEMTDIDPKCNSCHPGPITRCNRGAMAAAGLTCDDSNCHGSMANVAESQKEGRKAWLQEPDCGNCHGANYASNPSTLYRNSYLINNSVPGMNNLIQCISCHNSPHSEWTSTLPIDNKIPLSLQGTDLYINKCSVCHEGEGIIHNK